ncbi:MAG: photosynthetic complex assembly protein PuhC [Ideonella sp.]|nr:photosynthetic complex assembly protein PuhC [Ideonella sp.]
MKALSLVDSPKVPLAAMATLILMTLLAVAGVRVSGLSAQQQPDAPSLSVRQLHFEDQADGGIAMRDAQSGALLGTVAPGTNGFLRSAMRGLARERKRQSQGSEMPFELHARADGRLTLIDPGTQRRIDLESFGPSNMAVFAQLVRPTTLSKAP